MKRILLTLWGLWCIALAFWGLPMAETAWGHATDDGRNLALILWACSCINAIGGGSCIAGALLPRRN